MASYFDCHNHLQDKRMEPYLNDIIVTCRKMHIKKMVVNGTCEDDWEAVINLSKAYHEVIPSLGLHPWYCQSATPHWFTKLSEQFSEGHAIIGEIGLDKSKRNIDFDLQKRFFLKQLELASTTNSISTIHCVGAWGPLLDILKEGPPLNSPLIIHSFSGSKEIVRELLKFKVYFSLPCSLFWSDNPKRLETIREIPLDRLLVESDAPFQPPPTESSHYAFTRPDGIRLNNPINIVSTTKALAEVYKEDFSDFTKIIEHNFFQIFSAWIL